MAEKTHTFRVTMSCEGCSNAVKNILGKIPEITSVETDVAKQEVVVKGTVTADLVIEKLTPWAKAASKEVSLISTV